MVKVSVVLPTYNRKVLLRRAIESVLSQTFDDFELIVIDDGSTDGTGAMVESFKSDSRFRYYRQENKGQSAARNRAIEIACGEFVAFLDSDNYWPKNRLELCVPVLSDAEPDVALVYGDGSSIDAAGKVVSAFERVGFPERCLYPLLLSNFVGMNSVLVRASAIQAVGGFNEAMRSGEDYDLWLSLALKYRFRYMPASLCFYLVEGSRVSDNYESVLSNNKASIERVLSSETNGLTVRQRINVWAAFYMSKGQIRASARDKAGALSAYVRALAYMPLRLRTWRAVLALLKP